MDGEPGVDRVEQILRREPVLLPFIVSLGVYYVSLQEQGEQAANTRYAMLKALDVTRLSEVSESVLLTAGRLKARYRISLTDAIIAAFARVHDAVLVHKDPEFEALAGPVWLEALPYKARKH